MTRKSTIPASPNSNAVTLIKTRDNLFQRVETLKTNRKKRHEYGQFVVESVAAINAAVANNWKIEALLFSATRKLSSWANDLLASGVAKNRYAFSDQLLSELSDREEPSELIAVVKTKSDDPTRIRLDETSTVVVLDRPHSPGNLGTVLRSADAFGAQGVFVVGHAADIYDPLTVRSSIGALFSVPVVRLASPDDLLRWCSEQEFSPTLIGTSAKATTLISDFSFPKPLVLVFGNETTGLSTRFTTLCQQTLRIPIHGTASSLNLGCAVSIFLFAAEQASRQRASA